MWPGYKANSDVHVGMYAYVNMTMQDSQADALPTEGVMSMCIVCYTICFRCNSVCNSLCLQFTLFVHVCFRYRV